MKIIGISLNHNTCDLNLREAVYLNDEEKSKLIYLLKDKYLSEGIVISTCNRTEIYGVTVSPEISAKDLRDAILKIKPQIEVKEQNYLPMFACSAVNHLLKVATGIDSMIVGDSQILGQVKDAFLFSEEHDFLKSIFHRLQLVTLKTGKRAILETMIGNGAVSISYAAIKVIEKIFNNLETKNALIVGAGETGELAAIHLKDKNVRELAIANRTEERGKNLAGKVGGKFLHFHDFKSELHKYDIIISATSANDYILHFEDFKKAIKKRKGNPVVVMDIAIPRDIDPKVAGIDEIFYHDIDSLKVIVESNLEKRKKEIPRVKEIIEQEAVGFFAWYNTLEILPTLKLFREFFEEIRSDEIEKISHKFDEHQLEKIDRMTRRLIGRVLHNPTLELRHLSENGKDYEKAAEYSQIIRELFKLEEK